MHQSPEGELVVDDVALASVVRRLAPIVGELDAIVAEVESVLGDLRRDCAGHRTGTEFASAQTAFARSTDAHLRGLRQSVHAFATDLTRASDEIGAVDVAGAARMRPRPC